MFARSAISTLAKRTSFSAVNTRIISRSFTMQYQEELTEDDKWSKDKMEVPYEIPGKTTGVDFAIELFRYAYNKNQLGLFFQGCKNLQEYFQENGKPLSLRGNADFFTETYELGIPDEIAHDFLIHMYDVNLKSEIDVTLKTFIDYYYAFNRYYPNGRLIHGKKLLPRKYVPYLNRNLVSSVCSTTKLIAKRVQFSEDVSYALLGGYNIEVGETTEVHSMADHLLKLRKRIKGEDKDIIEQAQE